jgi:multidrug efflux pump subunit AcrA (membrane-fusion protein)
MAATILFGFGLTGCRSGKSAGSQEDDMLKPVPVKVETVSKTTVEAVVSLTGKIKAAQEVAIIPRISGRVDRVAFDVGQTVGKDDILFTLDDSDLMLQVKQAEAVLEAAKAALNKARGGAAEQQVIQLKSAVTSAQINYDDAKLNYDRIKGLMQSGAATQQTLEAAESRLKLAGEQLASAKSSLDVVQTKINPENIAAAEAQVKQSQASLDIMKSQLEKSTVRSPIAGVVAVRNIDAGELVGNTNAAMVIIDNSSFTVDIGVTEDSINKIKLNDRAEVIVKALSNEPLEGKITSISPSVDARSLTYPVKIRVANNNGLLKAGMLAEIKLCTGSVENTTTVPLSSLVFEGGKSVVYVVDSGMAARRDIKTGFSDSKHVQVLEGIKENEMVVVSGQNLLKDGTRVTVTE